MGRCFSRICKQLIGVAKSCQELIGAAALWGIRTNDIPFWLSGTGFRTCAFSFRTSVIALSQKPTVFKASGAFSEP